MEIPHHPSGGALPGEHRADAEGAVDKVNEKLTLVAPNSNDKRGIATAEQPGYAVERIKRCSSFPPFAGEGKDRGK